MYDLVPSEYRECLKPLAEVLKASISFMWGGNGFVAKESRCFLSVGSDHELVLSISSVKSIHFVSGQNGVLLHRLFPLFSELVAHGCGRYLASKAGYWWVITDIKGYEKLCVGQGFTPNDFRLYPKVDVVWMPDYESTGMGA